MTHVIPGSFYLFFNLEHFFKAYVFNGTNPHFLKKIFISYDNLRSSLILKKCRKM